MYPESDLSHQLHEITKETIANLDAIWDEVGLDDDTRRIRKQLFSKHVQELYGDMLAEAEASKNALEKQIDSLLTQLTDLGNDLRLDITIPREDSPLHDAKMKLEFQLEKYRIVYEERKKEILKLESKQKHLCKSLGIPCRNLLTSPLPTEEELHDFKIYLEELSDQKFQREEIFLKKKSAIVEMMSELKIIPSLDIERKIVLGDDSAFQVSDENMTTLEEFYTSLVNQLEETKNKIAELRECVSNLWELLEESPEVRSQFLKAHPGNSVCTLRALKKEIARCQEKKKENIKLFVEKMRVELVSWWDKCRFGPEQRTKFIHFESDCFTEDLLTLHEIQMEKVKAYYEKNKHIYELVTKREQLWEKMIDLEHRANQPDRYKNRGGQLLQEEKERKVIACKLPKIEQELLGLVEQYETEAGTAFLVSGSRVSEIIESAWEEHKENKHITLSARKHARENSRMTPCRSRVGTPRLHTPATPYTLLSTSKRKLYTPQTTIIKRSRIGDEKLLRSVPAKLQVNASTIRRVSLERKKRMERLKKRSKPHSDKDLTIASTISEGYVGFEEGLQTKTTCRSSLFPHKIVQTKTQQLPPSGNNNVLGTPRKVLQGLGNTPQRTPSRTNLRPKSPLTSSTSRLAAPPGALPIII